MFIYIVLPLSLFLTIQIVFRGVRAISSLANGSSFYTAGADGMICMIDFTTGKVLEKFKGSSKAVSCISVSPGMILHSFCCNFVSLVW